MANISLLSRLVNGVQRQVDLSTNTLVVSDLQINGINLRNASNGTEGSRGIGDFNSYTHFTPTAATIKGALSGIDAALGTATSALDGTFRIDNTADPTKQIAFSAAGISTGTTRTITMPDSNVDLGKVATAIQRDGSVAFTANQPMAGFKFTGLGAGTGAGDSVRYEQAILVTGANAFTAAQSFGGFKATNLADPTNPQDAATKNYTDNLAQGLSWKHVVRAASTANLNLASMPATVDGVTLASLDRFLAKDQTTSSQNGIYVFNGAGSAATRSSDADTAVELTWATVEIGADSVTQAGYIFRESLDITTIGTDPVAFAIISHGLDWTFNNGLSVTGNQVNVAPGDTSLTATAGSLVVRLNAAGGIVTSTGLMINLASSNPGLAITTNQLDVKYNPAGAIVASASGITWNPDGSSLEISANAARIKTTAYDQVTITGGGGSAAAVASAPKLGTSEVAGEAFAATTVFAVRWAVAADAGFVAGRVYKADYDTTSTDKFHVIGLVFPAGSVSTGGAITVTEVGLINVPTHGFTVGQPIFLTAAGALSNTAPSTTLQAVVIVGYAKDANNIWVKTQIMGVN